MINFLHEDTKQLHQSGKLWDQFAHLRGLANPKRHLNVFMTAEGARCASPPRSVRRRRGAARRGSTAYSALGVAAHTGNLQSAGAALVASARGAASPGCHT